MIKISKLSDLEGAERYGTCTVCHKNSNDEELYSITFENEGYISTVRLCKDCMIQLTTKLLATIGKGEDK